MFRLIGLLFTILIIYLIYKFFNPTYIIVNSIMGILIFFILNFLGIGIPINIYSVGIAALGGIPGVILVLLIHFLGFGFWI